MLNYDPKDNCGDKPLSGFQEPVCGLAALETPGQNLPQAWPQGKALLW
jgi:hypothetical protein